MNKQKILRSERNFNDTAVFMACWISYFSAYLGRYDLNAVLPEIIHSGLADKVSAGFIGGAFLLCYGIGHLINGILGDRIKPKNMILIGLAGSALCNIFFAFAKIQMLMVVLWGINGYCQSMLWGPLIRLISMCMNAKRAHKSIVNLQTSMFGGTIVAYGLSALMMMFFGWQSIFLCVGIIELAIALTAYIIFNTQELRLLQNEEMKANVPEHEVKPIEKVKITALPKIFLASGLLLITISVMMGGILKDGVSMWLPTYVVEQFSLPSENSLLSIMFIPIVNMAGLYAAVKLNKRLKKNELLTAAICFAVGALSFLILLLFGQKNIFIALISFSLASGAMFGINTMFLALLPIRFVKKGCISSVAGVLDSASYLTSAVASYVIGLISELYGWNMIILMWLIAAIAGIGAILAAYRTWHRYLKKEI